jgi:hypothetical protein
MLSGGVDVVCVEPGAEVRTVDQQVLVILDADQTAALQQVLAACRNLQVGSNRVLTLECPPAEVAKLQAMSGVTVVTADNPLFPMGQSLTAGESLFVDGWLRRIKEAQSKQRPGDALPWDAPGFTPPDPPTGATKSSKT